LPAVDGLRGLLALVVMLTHMKVVGGGHVMSWLGEYLLAQPANIATCGFFGLSGYVLTRSWNGRFGLFLVRRFLRLWPVYALCLAAGYVIVAVPPVWTQFFWYPLLTANSKPQIDPPIWSLCIEAWAMLFMPLIVWAGTGKLWRALLVYGLAVAASISYAKFAFGEYFLIGAFLSRWEFRSALLASPIPQWLGRISYSLYLTHWHVFTLAHRYGGVWGVIASIPVAFLVAWLIWRLVESPSIRLSRRVEFLGGSATTGIVAPATAKASGAPG
jgi:peptidoglycan/LPS O-acetylase OafA/YrhL